MHSFSVDLILDASEFIELEGPFTSIDGEDEASEDEASEDHGSAYLLNSIEECFHIYMTPDDSVLFYILIINLKTYS